MGRVALEKAVAEMRVAPARNRAFAVGQGVWGVARPGAVGIPAIATLALVGFVVVGAFLRVVAALRLPVFVDEPNSVLGMRAVAEHGVPRLPSGILYLHGATLSYLTAPLAWLGLGDLADLQLLRLVSVVAGTMAVYLTYRVARAVGGSEPMALLATGLVAFDPISIVWSGHFRMYALLQVLALAAVWLFVRAAAPATSGETGSRRGVLVGFVVAFWLAVFTQIAVAALWPALVLAAVMTHGRALLKERRDMTAALGCCLLAPLLFVALNALFGEGVGTARLDESDALPGASFIGNHYLSPASVLHPDFQGWQKLFVTDLLQQTAPLVVVGLSAVLLIVTRGRFAGPRHGHEENGASGIVSMLLLYWVPLLGITFFTTAEQPRYLIFLQPLCAIIVAAAIVALLGPRERASNAARWSSLPNRAALATAALVLLYVGVGLHGLTAWGTREARGTLVTSADTGETSCVVNGQTKDRGPVAHRLPSAGSSLDCLVTVTESQYSAYVPALHYVAARHIPGEPILVALPAVAYLTLGDVDDVQFLAGPRDSARTSRYTRPMPSGTRDDYWIGVPAVTSVADLCGVMRAHPDSWLVLDQSRLKSKSAFGGPMKHVIDGAAEAELTVDGAMVLRPMEPSQWKRRVAQQCAAYGA